MDYFLVLNYNTSDLSFTKQFFAATRYHPVLFVVLLNRYCYDRSWVGRNCFVIGEIDLGRMPSFIYLTKPIAVGGSKVLSGRSPTSRYSRKYSLTLTKPMK